MIQLGTKFQPMTARRQTQRLICRGKQELERSGYGAEVLTFLGLASFDGITFAALRDKTIVPSEMVPVSQAAWRAEGSRMFIQPRKAVTVR